jgi:hypothetical protein
MSSCRIDSHDCAITKSDRREQESVVAETRGAYGGYRRCVVSHSGGLAFAGGLLGPDYNPSCRAIARGGIAHRGTVLRGNSGRGSRGWMGRHLFPG